MVNIVRCGDMPWLLASDLPGIPTKVLLNSFYFFYSPSRHHPDIMAHCW